MRYNIDDMTRWLHTGQSPYRAMSQNFVLPPELRNLVLPTAKSFQETPLMPRRNSVSYGMLVSQLAHLRWA